MWLPVFGECVISPAILNLAVLVWFLCLLYMWYNRSYQTAWSGLGVKVPKYEFFYGFSRAAEGTTLSQYMNDIFRRYGKNAASYFEARRIPTLATYDVKLLKHILVKDFNNFVDRNYGLPSKSNIKNGLFFIGGNSWRRIRTLLTPLFSSGKLKLMVHHVNRVGEALGKHMVKLANEEKQLDVKRESGNYTSDLIASLGFGVDPKAVGKSQDGEFTKYTKSLINPEQEHWAYKYIYWTFIKIFPFTFPYLRGMSPDIVYPAADRYFTELLDDTISRRKSQGPSKHPDFLDIMMSTEAEDNDIALTLTSKVMTHDEIVGQSKLLLFAAYETTSTTLAMALYHLAKYPDVQERVYQEFLDVVQNDQPTYDELNKLKYTEQVINETLRLFPPLKTISRLCKETRTYDGFTIPGETHITIHIWKIHTDPEYWEDPEQFNPDRFSDEEKAKRDPLTFIPFGYGPRLCIGQRLAYMELKAGLVHVLKRVKLELNEKTEPKLGEDLTIKDAMFITPEKNIMIAATTRKSAAD